MADTVGIDTLETQSPASVAAGALLWNKGFKNHLINGDFRLWQRGVSLPAGTGVRYLADRWSTSATGSTAAPSLQPFALGQTAVPGAPKYFHRVVVASATGASNSVSLSQFHEGVERLAGQAVTVSFYAKADAARSMAVEVVQSFGSGGAPSTPVLGIGATKLNLTTSWARYSVTIQVPGVSGKTLGTVKDATALNFWLDAGSSLNSRTGVLGQQSGTFDIASVQLETGKVATAFEVRPDGLELQLCQRYYWKTFDRDVAPAQNAGSFKGAIAYVANFNNSGFVGMRVQYPVVMRGEPVVTFYNPGAANAKWRNRGLGADSGAAEISYGEVGESSIIVVNNQVAADAIGHTIFVHAAFDAEF